MQIAHIVPPVTLFSEYVYFSSFSDQMLQHAREAAQRYIREKELDDSSLVVEVASNDGYFLKNFVKAGVLHRLRARREHRGEVARKNGIETLNESSVKATAR